MEHELVIPEIHITDLQTFTTCRRKWDLSSNLRQSRQPSFPPEPLVLGLGVHEALDYGYQNSVQTGKPMAFDFDAARARFDSWLTARQVKIIEHTGPLWPHEEDILRDIRKLGLAMLKHYSLWAPSVDRHYTLLSTEESFQVPIPTPATDTRTSYRALCYAGRFDGMVRNLRTGNISVLEFKTAKDMSRMAGTFRGMQATAYIWASKQVYNLDVVGVHYRVLRKRIPDEPKALRAPGRFSRAKNQKISWEWFKYYVQAWCDAKDAKYSVVLAANNDVRQMLLAKDNEFFRYKNIPRTAHQIKECVRALAYEGQQMANPDIPIYPLTGFHCNWCSFREVCDLMAAGLPHQDLLEAEYASRDYWDKES